MPTQSVTNTKRLARLASTPGVAWEGWWAAHRIWRLARLPSAAGMVPAPFRFLVPMISLWEERVRVCSPHRAHSGERLLVSPLLPKSHQWAGFVAAGCAQLLHLAVDTRA